MSVVPGFMYHCSCNSCKEEKFLYSERDPKLNNTFPKDWYRASDDLVFCPIHGPEYKGLLERQRNERNKWLLEH